MGAIIGFGTASGGQTAKPPESLRVEVLKTYPHDRGAFTQGLVLHQGSLYESTGLVGKSSLRQVELATGRVVRKIDVPPPGFSVEEPVTTEPAEATIAGPRRNIDAVECAAAALRLTGLTVNVSARSRSSHATPPAARSAASRSSRRPPPSMPASARSSIPVRLSSTCASPAAPPPATA